MENGCLQFNFTLKNIPVFDHTKSIFIWSNVKFTDDILDKILDFLEVSWSNTSWAIQHKHNICTLSITATYSINNKIMNITVVFFLV